MSAYRIPSSPKLEVALHASSSREALVIRGVLTSDLNSAYVLEARRALFDTKVYASEVVGLFQRVRGSGSLVVEIRDRRGEPAGDRRAAGTCTAASVLSTPYQISVCGF